jgi:MraZ protein
MSDAQTKEPTYYNSRFLHGVDEKRRVQIPAKWRPGKSGTELTLVVWPQHQAGACLRVLPPSQMAKTMADINALANDNPKKGFLKRFIGSKSVQATLDKAGRICLPDGMARESGIKNEAVLVGRLDCFEIWNPARYENVEAADAVLASEAFKLME